MAEEQNSSKFVVQTFSNPVSDKLDDENFLSWSQQAESTIYGYDLQNHLDPDEVPNKFVSNEDHATGKISQEFKNWRRQDKLLMSWLLASMTSPFTTRMVGCDTAHQIWSRVQEYFASQTRAKIAQLKTELKDSKKQGSVVDYILHIKKIVDTLAAVGSPVNVAEHIETIMEGLLEEYDGFITSIVSRTDPYSVSEIESLLMA